MPLLRIEGVSKSFGALAAVRDVSLDIGPGEFFALLGPSGCGKTTLMRLIAGFETPDSGRIVIGGEDATGLPPHRRPVNMVFQSYALFPHMSVAQNVAFGLVQDGMPRREIAARVSEMLRLVQLEGLETRRPDKLSGGQRQRVALARALARRPRLVLLDEPLAALDRKLREDTQFELMRVQRELGTAFLLVTHDQDEAMVMANRIGVMREGRIEQLGSARQLYDVPQSRWIAGFIGEINLFEAKVEALLDAPRVMDGTHRPGRCRVFLVAEGLPRELSCEDSLDVGQDVMVAVRPEKLQIVPANENQPGLAGSVVDVAFKGETIVHRVRLDSDQVVRASGINRAAEEGAFQRGDRVRVRFEPDAARVLVR